MTFLKVELGLPVGLLERIGPVEITPIFSNPRSKSKIHDEVSVLFNTVEVRDSVRRAARELGGDPNAGVRLEVPTWLQSNLKALDALCYALKQKHPKLKRNIKFDDDALDLIMEFNTDPDDPSKKWRRVTPQKAKEQKHLLGNAGQACEITSDDLSSMLQ